jgi:hypothetical protein
MKNIESAEATVATEEVVKSYPTEPNAEGLYFESAEEEEKGISTKQYDNENVVKQVTLKGGRVAVIRELLAKDVMKAREIAGIKDDKNPRNGENLQYALVHLSVTIDGKTILPHDVAKMKAKDFGIIMGISSDLNF